MRPIDEASAAFLQSVADDLQRQLGTSGTVVTVALDDVGSDVAIVAVVSVGNRTVEFRGVGDSVLTAYADLGRAAPEPILASAFRQVMNV